MINTSETFNVYGTSYILNGINDYEKCLELWLIFLDQSIIKNTVGIMLVEQFQMNVINEYVIHTYENDFIECDIYTVLPTLTTHTMKKLGFKKILKYLDVMDILRMCLELLRTFQNTI